MSTTPREVAERLKHRAALIGAVLVGVAWVLVITSLASHHWQVWRADSPACPVKSTTTYIGLFSSKLCTTTCDNLTNCNSITNPSKAAGGTAGSFIIIGLLVSVVAVAGGVFRTLNKQYGKFDQKLQTLSSICATGVFLLMLFAAFALFPILADSSAGDYGWSFYITIFPILVLIVATLAFAADFVLNCRYEPLV